MPVTAYLGDVMAADTTVFAAARAELEALRAELDAAKAPRWEALAAWRLLASNSLRARDAGAGRAAWDRANAVVVAALERAEEPRFPVAQRIHDALDGPAAVRTEAIFSADERYLAAEEIPAQIALLEAAIAEARDGLEAAFRAYVGLVTIHPFANGNGRTARLFADLLLMRDGRLPLCFASPIASHVAQTHGGVTRTPPESFRTFAEGIANAYRAVLSRP